MTQAQMLFSIAHRSEGFPRTGYFIHGHVGGWGWTDLGRSSAGALQRSEIPGYKQLDGTPHGEQNLFKIHPGRPKIINGCPLTNQEQRGKADTNMPFWKKQVGEDHPKLLFP